MQQAYITMYLTYLAVFVLPNGTDMSYKPIPVIACVSFAILRKNINSKNSKLQLIDQMVGVSLKNI
ncbi:MAG: hypothetical protein V2I50_06465 [Desulfuromusa sp.]|jgi:hypothetical protein|nr:hypothetical protein [Desulfuromusa sp.]